MRCHLPLVPEKPDVLLSSAAESQSLVFGDKVALWQRCTVIKEHHVTAGTSSAPGPLLPYFLSLLTALP